MDGDTSAAEVSEEEFAKMERDIDEFLSSIRENVSKNSDPYSEATGSGVNNDYDSISSDEDESTYHSRSDEPAFLSDAARKYSDNSSTSKSRDGSERWKSKAREVRKERENSSREERDSRERRGRRQRELSSSGDEHDQYRRRSSSRRENYYPERSVSPRERDEYHRSSRMRGKFQLEKSIYSRETDHRNYYARVRHEFNQERSVSPREGRYHHRSLLPREREEYCEEMSPPGRRDHQEDRYVRRNFLAEEAEEFSEDDSVFDENPSHYMSHRSRSKEAESMYHRLYAEESDSSEYWYENQDDDYDFEDQNRRRPYRRHEEGDPFTEDLGILDTTSVVTACLKKMIAENPGIAQKISNACMSLLNKPVERTCDSDYDCEESSCGSYGELSNRISPRSWRDSRSPSLSFSEALGSRHSKNSSRYEGHSQRIVVLRSPSPEPGHSSDDRLREARYPSSYKRTASNTSQTLSTKKRSVTNHHKNYHEEDPITSVTRTMRKIRKQCEEESDKTVRRALLALLEVHQRECDMYLGKPDAHPDYNKEYRKFLEKKSNDIIELGGDPNEFDFQQEWKKYWPKQMIKLFRESWDATMHKCTSMLLKRGHPSKSLHASSRKDKVSPPAEKKQKTRKHNGESAEKSQKDSESAMKSIEENQELQTSAAESQVKKEEMESEILSILKLLNHIKHRFKNCEASFDIFFQKVLSLKQENIDLCDILQSNLPLLKEIDTNLKETLQDETLNIIQKVIIQETHGRFKSFLEKSQEINLHALKTSDNSLGKAVEMTDASQEVKICKSSKITPTTSDEKESVETEEKCQIPCRVTEVHPSVVPSLCPGQVTCTAGFASKCYDCNRQLCRPLRTLTEVSIQDSLKATVSNVPNQPKDGSTCLISGVVKMKESSDMMQPPPPGVTPPPPGVTPPPPGITPPPPGVTPPPPGVTPPPPGVTPPPPGVTSSPTPSVTQPSSVAPSFQSATSPSSIMSPCVESPHHTTIPPSSCKTLTLLDSTAPLPSVTQPPSGITSPPPVSLASHSHSSASTVSQASDSQSLLVSNLPMSCDAAAEPSHHPSTTSTVQISNFLHDKDAISTPETRAVQQRRKEILRTTIKDCFMSAHKKKTGSQSTTEESEVTNKAEDSVVSSMPSLPEDILKMFVVKPGHKSENNASNKSVGEMSGPGNYVESDIKTAEKKPIKITIPQFPKRKSMPAFNPIVDDQELL